MPNSEAKKEANRRYAAKRYREKTTEIPRMTDSENTENDTENLPRDTEKIPRHTEKRSSVATDGPPHRVIRVAPKVPKSVEVTKGDPPVAPSLKKIEKEAKKTGKKVVRAGVWFIA